jgi:hypothetical protein
MEMNIIQFDVELHLPRVQEIIFTDVNQQLHDILNVYQQHIDPNAHWYPMRSTAKGKPKALIYSPEGFTEYGLKKIARACKKIEKKGDVLFHFADSQKLSNCHLMSYVGYKAIEGSHASKSKVVFFFTLENNSKTISQMVSFIGGLAEKFSQCYITMRFQDSFCSLRLFPPRINTSLIVYIPSPLQESEYQEAHQLIPIYKEGKHVGTVIVLFDHFPDEANKEDAKTIYHIELKLREADLLPMKKDL